MIQFAQCYFQCVLYRELWHTGTGVAIDQVSTSPLINAWAWHAIVYVCFTVSTIIARDTGTVIIIQQVLKEQ